MKTINTSTENSYPKWVLTAVALLLIISGCSLSGIDKQDEEITEEDLQAASQIVGESLSDETSGVMGSLNDAITTISSDGFVRSGSLKDDDDDNSGRGREFNFSYSYDPSTGTHTLAFMRSVTKPNFSKSVTDSLKYIFTDNDGNFIGAPRANKERIETIDFKGFKEGTLESPSRNSFFSRRDTFFIAGVSQASEVMSIDGVHNGRGNAMVLNDDSVQVERDYQVEFNFLNIEIDKSVVQENRSLEQGVTGTLTYEIVIEKTNNGSSSTKTIRGTVEMNGDGTALLRFERFSKLFQINLDDGDVRDQDDEFEGKVKRVNLDRSSFSLANGRVVRITDDTKIDDDGDLFNLEQVGRALEEGAVVEAEGEGFVDGDVFVATEVKFETDLDDDNEVEEVDFEAFISDVNLDKRTIVLQDERVILVTEDTQIDDSGNLKSLEAVKEALELGRRVVADGEGVKTNEEGISLIARELRFDEVDQEKIEFEGRVLEVNLNDRILAITHGDEEDERIVWINEETEIDASGDYQSLEGVKEALELGWLVIAYGNAVESDKEGVDLIAKEIRFDKVEQEKVEFEDLTVEVNLDENILTLEDGTVVWINEETTIDDSGDYLSLGAVKEALEQDINVIASGKAVESNKEDINLNAIEIKFNKEED